MFLSENKLRKIIKEILIEAYAKSGFLGDIEDVDKDLNTHAGSYEDVERLADESALEDDENEWLYHDYRDYKYNTYKKVLYKHEDPIVKDILRLRREGLSTSEITDEINKLGYKTKKGTPIADAQVLRIIKKFSTTQDVDVADQNGTHIIHRKKAYARKDPVVKVILRLRRKGLSTIKIADELNKLGYRTKNNTPIEISQIYKIINKFSTTKDIDVADQNRTHRKRAYSREDPLVKDVLRLSKEGLSTRKIADELNKLGYKTNKGTPIASAQVSRIINKFNNA